MRDFCTWLKKKFKYIFNDVSFALLNSKFYVESVYKCAIGTV